MTVIVGWMSVDGVTEWEQSEFHQFEMLETKRNSDYSHAEDETPAKVGQSDGYSTDKPPDDVHDSGEAARRP